MIRIVIYILAFLLAGNALIAQPLKTNLPFSQRGIETGEEDFSNLSMSDFRYQAAAPTSSSRLVNALQTKPGLALLSSALIPGTGQAANNKWVRAGAYFAADLILLAVHFHSQHRAKELQREYEQFADNNWSVVTYAKWLVDYHEQNNISNPYIGELQQQVQDVNPAYDPGVDWNTVDIQTLRNVENNTPFITTEGVGNNFSHEMPAYGSQQYYELISKYYQYGPGWNSFGVNREGQPLDSIYQLAWNGSDMPPHFFEGASLSDRFNNKYRIAGNMLAYMLLNHVVSAFDAFITVKLKNNKLETQSNIFGPQQFILKYHF